MEAEGLRLLWITENYPPNRGGMACACDRIVRQLRGAGVVVDLVHLSRRATRWSKEIQNGGSLFTCPADANPPHTFNLLWNLLSREKVAYTHLVAFGGYLPLIGGPVLASWLQLPLVVLIRGNDFDEAIFVPKRRAYLLEAFQRAAAVCVVSEDKVHKIQRLTPEAHVTWITNGIELEEWELLPSERARAEEWKRPFKERSQTVIGLFGHLKSKKGGLFFLKCLLQSGLQEQVHLLLVGEPGPAMLELLEEEAQALSVTRFPFLDRYELLPLYARCDFVALPSFYDGTPNVLLESMALGVPTIGSRCGGMADLVEHGETGYLFDPGDPHGCRESLYRALHLSPEEVDSMSRRCKQKVQEELTASLERDRYLTLFRGLQRDVQS